MTRFQNRTGAARLALAIVTVLSFSATFADDHGRHNGDGDRRWESRDEFKDSRHHHDHYYPIPGRVVQVLPPRHEVVVHRDTRFYFSSGIWYRPDGVRYVVAAPPIGIVIHTLPPYPTRVWVRGAPYYYANNVYYVQSPQGYVVATPPPSDAIIEEPLQGNANNSTIIEQQANADELSTQNLLNPAFVYPSQNQNAQQHISDRNECNHQAGNQLGIDTSAGSVISGEQLPAYRRVLSACLKSRGYTLR